MKATSPSPDAPAAPHWPAGFRFAAGHCGIKAAAPDLLLITTPRPAACAAVFTTNQVQAAPVRLSRAHLRASRGRVRALVVNSGNANCSTGKAGERAARQIALATARLLECAPQEVLVASTGVIGVPLDAGRITAALPAWTARHDSPEAAAHAILTTDTRVKMASRCWTDTG
ncbi:MAG: bifunctional ornithine acetyltransferase/N-acetylglutamate synthase, partial [Terriglobales bacterium]